MRSICACRTQLQRPKIGRPRKTFNLHKTKLTEFYVRSPEDRLHRTGLLLNEIIL